MAWDSVDLESLDESRGVGRRSFLIGALAAGAAASAPINYAAAARKGAGALAKEGSFDLGIAAGFPRPRGIMLWTHLDEVKGSPKVRLVVAKDQKFANVVEERLVTASSKNGHTARTFVNGLDPREQYFYRFLTEGSKSEVGRFRTAPPLNSREKIRIAFYSCQNYEAGFFNAQRAIAREKDIDLVICLGDYIYEYSDQDIRQRSARTAPAATTTATSSSSTSTARSTSSTRATRSCRRCTPPIPSSRSGTTTRSRTTTPTASPARPRTTPTRPTARTIHVASASSSAA